jgi:acetyl-CoA carboxylase carboxyltransferase component
VLDADSSQKGARLVSKCDAFGIPLVVLVDTPGYMPGSKQEGAGVIRFGASLVHAFAAASYAQTQRRPEIAAAGGHVDELIAPAQTRARLAWALASLGAAR